MSPGVKEDEDHQTRCMTGSRWPNETAVDRTGKAGIQENKETKENENRI